jgi:hypothetical protein
LSCFLTGEQLLEVHRLMLEKGERGAQNGPTNLVVCCSARPWLFLKLVKLTKSQAVVSLTVASTNSREIFSLIGGVISVFQIWWGAGKSIGF